MTKHTPGPWDVNDDLDIYSSHPDMDEIVASCVGHKIDAALFSDIPGRAEANARLIAAAPDLLDSLEQMVAESDCGRVPCMRTIDDARAAIAKAAGGADA
ncbi:MAG: hypothetical protein K2P78_04525 [Gemmataceae bacterium]|nr:hypothetical protein [Gemmataceae bacterium]